MTPEIAAIIEEVRMKVLRGEATPEDIAKAIEVWRTARGITMQAAQTKKTKAKKEEKHTVDLLNSIIGEQK